MAHIQIRNVPADVHRKLRAHAANAGQSVSEYALDELVRSVERNDGLDGLATASTASTSPVSGHGADAEHGDDPADAEELDDSEESAVDDSVYG